MNTVKKYLSKYVVLPVLSLLFLSFCTQQRELVTQPPNFQPDSFLHPNEYGIKNATEFLKQSHEIIENSKFVPAQVEGGLRELINNVKYPSEAENQFQQGKVYLNLFINKKGEVVFVRVLESADNRLTRYSIYAVKNTDFLPATLNDRPVKSTRLVMFDFSFRLDNDVNY